MSYQLNVRCKFCDRFIPIEANASSNIRVRCNDRKCKQWNDVKIVMLTDYIKEHKCTHECNHDHTDKLKEIEQVNQMKELASQLDGRTKEAKELQAKIVDMEKYIESLEGIVDGQG